MSVTVTVAVKVCALVAVAANQVMQEFAAMAVGLASLTFVQVSPPPETLAGTTLPLEVATPTSRRSPAAQVIGAVEVGVALLAPTIAPGP